MCLPYFPSPTVTWMWQVCFRMTLPRPLARAVKRRKFSALSTQIIRTLSSSMSAPSLCSALAIADSSTFLMIFAPFFGLKASRLSAFSTGRPRIWSATSRPFWAERRTPHNVARVSIVVSLLLLAARGRRRRGRAGTRCRSARGSARSAGTPATAARSRRGRGFEKLLVGHAVALENPSQGELAQLVPDHVLRNVHGHVLLAVMNGNRQPDEIRQDGGAPRPGLDRAFVVRGARGVDLLHQVMVHEGTFLD